MVSGGSGSSPRTDRKGVCEEGDVCLQCVMATATGPDADGGVSSPKGGGLTRSGRTTAGFEFQLIPNEIALTIFGYLDMRDLLSISQTCKHWNSISEDDFLWKPLYKKAWSVTVPGGAGRPTPKGMGAAGRTRMKRNGSLLDIAGLIRRSPESDQEQIRGWRSWKNKYVARRNWLAGRFVCHTTISVHKPQDAESLTSMRFDHEKYAAGSTDGCIYIRSVEDGRALQTLTGHLQAVTALQLEGNLLVSGSKDNTAKVWRGPAGAQECVLTLTGHQGSITCLQFVGHHLMTRSWDLSGRVWDLNTGQLLHKVM